MIYKAPNNDTRIADSAPEGWIEITQEELEVILESRVIAPPPPSIQSQIDALDGGDPMARPTREFMILSMEEKAVAAGYTIAHLRASHYAYRKVKELDEQIASLRSQL